MALSKYEQKLLDGWEDVYKKSQLTLWILLALKNGPKQMTSIKLYIEQATAHVLSVDDKSMYRALRRFKDADLVTYRTTPSLKGPDLKIYSLSHTGLTVLDSFISRNVLPLQELLLD